MVPVLLSAGTRYCSCHPQAGEPHGREVDLVGGDIEIGDQVAKVGTAGVVVAVTVQATGEHKDVRSGTSGEGVHTRAAVEPVVARAATEAVVTRQAEQGVGRIAAQQRVAGAGAGDHTIEDEVAGGQGAGEVARENQFEAIAAGIGIIVLDVGAVAAGAVADLQGAATAIAQSCEAEAGEIDLVLGDVEVGDGVIEACGCVAVTVGMSGETERIGAGTAGEFVDACTPPPEYRHRLRH